MLSQTAMDNSDFSGSKDPEKLKGTNGSNVRGIGWAEVQGRVGF